MDITPLIPQGRQIIQAYKNGQFRVSNQIFQTPILVCPDRVELWHLADAQDPQPSDFDPLLSDKPDVILFGCGPIQIILPHHMKKALKEKGLFVETMETGAACRTFNVLMAEGRRVAAALLPV